MVLRKVLGLETGNMVLRKVLGLETGNMVLRKVLRPMRQEIWCRSI
jgi:hypothetical protein